MYGIDDAPTGPISNGYLFTHGLDGHQGHVDEPPVRVPGPVFATEPFDLAPPMDALPPDAEMGLREWMWGLFTLGLLCPLVGVVSGGFHGFLWGMLIGALMHIGAFVIRRHRITLVKSGRTDLEFSETEVKTELTLGAVVAAIAVYQGLKHLMRSGGDR